MRSSSLGSAAALVALASACAVQIGGTPPPQPAGPRAYAAPAPAPAPAPHGPGFSQAMLGQGAHPTPAPAPAPVPAGVHPLAPPHLVANVAYAIHYPGHIAVVPPSTDHVNFAAFAGKMTKKCGPQQVAPNIWVRIDCKPYLPLTLTTHKLFSARKARLLPLGALRLSSSSVNHMRTAAGAPAPGGGGGGPPAADPPQALPDVVDHRQDGTEGPVKNQGAVGSCTAFSLSSVMDNAILKLSKKDVMSPAHLWSHYAFPSMGTAGDSNLNKTITSLDTFPYSPREACEMSKDPEDDCGNAYGVVAGSGGKDPKLQGEIVKAEGSGLYKIVSIDALSTKPVNPDELVAVLSGGSDVWIAMDIGMDSWTAPVNNVIPDWATGDGGHAIVMAGYRKMQDGSRQYLIHNSWGATWGDQGYAWVSEAMIKQHMYFAYKVKVVDPNAATQPAQTDDDCDDESLVDAGTGLCAPMCWDDTRRTGGQCANPNPNPNPNSGGAQSTGAHAPPTAPRPPTVPGGFKVQKH